MDVRTPSIAKISQAIARSTQMESENSVENVKGIHKFVTFLGSVNPETVLEGVLNGDMGAAVKVEEFIDHALKMYAHQIVRGFLFGIKKWFELNGVDTDWKKI